jgi:hypothetical protein
MTGTIAKMRRMVASLLFLRALPPLGRNFMRF